MIEIILSEKDFEEEIQALVKKIFPGGLVKISDDTFENGRREKILTAPDVLYLGIHLEQEKIHLWLCCQEYQWEQSRPVSGEQDFHKHKDGSAHPYRTYYKNILKGLIYDELLQIPEEKLPAGLKRSVPAWGIMTGIRPARNAMQQILAGISREKVTAELVEGYRYQRDRAALCMEIAEKEAKCLDRIDYEHGYSLYVGIPFCPTTCLYCSFPSYPVEQFGQWIEGYLVALGREIQAFGSRLSGKRLISIYIGGGTPTALTTKQLQELIGCLQEHFPVRDACEFTVEAGRPDSITREKLQVLKRSGVSRISINPQTMQEKTLVRIGRRHTVDQVKRVYGVARDCGFEDINMDLIMGLPGESESDFADTLVQIGELAPDSVTMHSLVVKRASRLREELDAEGISFDDRARRMNRMFTLGMEFASQNGYGPYYIYCQKNAARYGGGLGQENIGFAKERKECLYNILMMEEMQSILALGAGASTKWMEPGGKRVRRIENVKSVTDYVSRIDEMIHRKENIFGTI